jgi:acyl carrier protein
LVLGPKEQGVTQRLAQELKALIVTSLRLQDLALDELQEDTPLFQEGLGLDSVDALELAVIVQRRYGVRIPAEEDEAGRVMFSIRTLATYLASAAHSVDTVT